MSDVLLLATAAFLIIAAAFAVFLIPIYSRLDSILRRIGGHR